MGGVVITSGVMSCMGGVRGDVVYPAWRFFTTHRRFEVTVDRRGEVYGVGENRVFSFFALFVENGGPEGGI